MLRELHRVFLTAVWRMCDSVVVWGPGEDSGAVSADWAYQPRPGARAEMGSPQLSAHSPGDER